MQKKPLRAVLSAVVILGALGFFLFTTMSQAAATYLRVDEVTPNKQAWYGKPLQLHGFVTGTILVEKNSLEYRFEVQNNGHVIKASYTGIVPDTFKTGSEVVLKGRLGPDGFQVEPDGVMAKCPSRYTASGPAGTGQ
jgi:cytochrome c-type biogenesis protein CcmE